MNLQSDWGYEYIVITPDRSLAFPSVEYVRSVVSKAGVKQGYSFIPVVIDSRHVQGADFTAAKVRNTDACFAFAAIFIVIYYLFYVVGNLLEYCSKKWKK